MKRKSKYTEAQVREALATPGSLEDAGKKLSEILELKHPVSKQQMWFLKNYFGIKRTLKTKRTKVIQEWDIT